MLKYLDKIDDIFGRPNLLTTLELLSKWAFFSDPILTTPPPVPVQGWGVDILQTNLRPWTIAYFAKVCLCTSNPYRRSDLNPKHFIDAVNYYNEADNPPSEDTDDATRSMLTRLIFQQLPLQREWWAGMTRAEFMYGSSDGPDERMLAQTLVDVCGMDYQEVLTLCMSIFFAFYEQAKEQKECSFTFDILAERFSPWVDKAKLAMLISLIHQTQDQFRVSCQSAQLPDRSLRKYDFNPLLSKPLIRIDDRYYAPVPALLPMWATDGIVYVLSQYAASKGLHDSFFAARGRAFEDFTEHLMKLYNKQYVRIAPVKIGGQDVTTADFALVEGQSALIFDCKTRPVSLQHRSGVISAVQRDYEDVVKALEQALTTEESIRKGIAPLSEDPLLSAVTDFFPAALTMDEFYLANSSLVQRQVVQDLKRQITYQVLSSREFELLLCNLQGRSLIDIIKEKAAVPDLLPTSYSDYLHHLKDRQVLTKLIDPSRQIVLSILQDPRSRIEAR